MKMNYAGIQNELRISSLKIWLIYRKYRNTGVEEIAIICYLKEYLSGVLLAFAQTDRCTVYNSKSKYQIRL
jgi:hypothetical protein